MRWHETEQDDIMTSQHCSLYSIIEGHVLQTGIRCLAMEEQSIVEISSSADDDLLEALSRLLMLSVLRRWCLCSCL